MNFKTLEWKSNYLRLIDQTKLPDQVTYIRCRTMNDAWQAIRKMKVRGAPAIGVTCAYGVYLGIRVSKVKTRGAFLNQFDRVIRKMAMARPTAKNLFMALDCMQAVVVANPKAGVELLKKKLFAEARRIEKEDRNYCDLIGRHGEKLFRKQDNVLTHCNAGALATAGIGTALGVIYAACRNRKKLTVYATETRPFLQGARLTSWELKANRVPVKLVCDNAIGYLMRDNRVDKVIVGADRIAGNGDTANKIGTYPIARMARAHGIPFYVAAPSTTFDFSIRTGNPSF